LQRLLDVRGAFQEVEVRRIIKQLVSALCYLRTRDIIHRDLKPANVMLQNPLSNLYTSPLDTCHTKLIDFGFAKVLGGMEASHHGASRHGHDGSLSRGNNFSPALFQGGSHHRGSLFASRQFEGPGHRGSLFNSREFEGSAHRGSLFRRGHNSPKGGDSLPDSGSDSPHGRVRDVKWAIAVAPDPSEKTSEGTSVDVAIQPAPSEDQGAGGGPQEASLFDSLFQRGSDSSADRSPPLAPTRPPPLAPALAPPLSHELSPTQVTETAVKNVLTVPRTLMCDTSIDDRGDSSAPKRPQAIETPQAIRMPRNLTAQTTLSVSPVGTRIYAPPILWNRSTRSTDANGNVAMSREEAHSLDVFPLGRLMHYMLTGVPPGKDILQALSDHDAAQCMRCLLMPFFSMPPARRIIQTTELTKEAQEARGAFLNANIGFTIFDARSHSWLTDEQGVPSPTPSPPPTAPPTRPPTGPDPCDA